MTFIVSKLGYDGNMRENNMRENKEEYLYCLRKIAFPETFEEYCANVSLLKDSYIWNDAKSKGFRNWIENTWLPKYEVF